MSGEYAMAQSILEAEIALMVEEIEWLEAEQNMEEQDENK